MVKTTGGIYILVGGKQVNKQTPVKEESAWKSFIAKSLMEKMKQGSVRSHNVEG